jgi:hypothetical protein
MIINYHGEGSDQDERCSHHSTHDRDWRDTKVRNIYIGGGT